MSLNQTSPARIWAGGSETNRSAESTVATARPRLANDAKHFAGMQRIAHVVDGTDSARLGDEVGHKTQKSKKTGSLREPPTNPPASAPVLFGCCPECGNAARYVQLSSNTRRKLRPRTLRMSSRSIPLSISP